MQGFSSKAGGYGDTMGMGTAWAEQTRKDVEDSKVNAGLLGGRGDFS